MGLDYKIWLIGMMGSGKTTIAKILAGKGYKHYDSDLLVESKANMKISEIFNKYGEAYFRQLEKQAIKELSNIEGKAVIATGGGCILDKENVELMKQTGFVFYLKAEINTLIERLSKKEQREVRPLIKDNIEKLKEIFEKRKNLYIEAANFIIETDNKKPEEIAEIILNKVDYFKES